MYIIVHLINRGGKCSTIAYFHSKYDEIMDYLVCDMNLNNALLNYIGEDPMENNSDNFQSHIVIPL